MVSSSEGLSRAGVYPSARFQEGCHLSSSHFAVRTEVVVDRRVTTEGYSGGSRFVDGILEN